MPSSAARTRITKTRILWGAFVLTAIVALVVTLPRLVLNAGDARRALLSEIETLAGSPVGTAGSIEMTILPTARVVAERVAIGPGRSFTIDRVVAELDRMDALLGKATIDRLEFVRPEFNGVAPETGGDRTAADPSRTSPVPAATLVDAAAPGSLASLAAFERTIRSAVERLDTVETITIRDGVWRPRIAGGQPNGFSNVNLDIAHGSGGAMRLAGSFIWNGQPAEVDLAIAARDGLADRSAIPVRLSFSAPPMSLGFEGLADLDDLRQLSGDISVSSPSFARAASWLGQIPTTMPDFAGLSVEGAVELAGRTLRFPDAAVAIEGNAGRGAFEYDLDARRLSGSLAFAQLAIDPIAAAVVPPPTGPMNLNRRIDLDFSRALSLDLRLSAGEAQIGPVRLDDLAAVIGMADGVLDVDIGDAGLYGGRLYGGLSLSSRNAPTLEGVVSASGVETRPLLAALGARAIGLSGTGRLDASFTGPATDWRSALGAIRTQATLVTTNGELSGFDPSTFAREGGRALFAGLSEGSVPFQRLEAEIQANGPHVRIRSLTLDDGVGHMRSRGSLSLATRVIGLEGVYDAAPQVSVVAEAGAGQFTASQPVRFTLDGRWPNPTVVTTRATGVSAD